MIIYIEKTDKQKECIEIYFQNVGDDRIFAEYDESIIYPDCLLLEYLIDEKNRSFELLNLDAPSFKNKDEFSYFCMILKDSFKYYEILKNLTSFKYKESIYNLQRCDIHLQDKDLTICFYVYCNKQKLNNGFRNLNYIEYLKNRFIHTLEFILNLYHVK